MAGGIAALLLKAEDNNRWAVILHQADGRETIAVVCRDEMAASRVNKALSCKLALADSRLETAEFTEGVSVPPASALSAGVSSLQ